MPGGPHKKMGRFALKALRIALRACTDVMSDCLILMMPLIAPVENLIYEVYYKTDLLSNIELLFIYNVCMFD